jgi:hypothetical protein
VKGKAWAWDGRYTYQKLQLVAEAVENRQKERILDGYTWQNQVWRDKVKSQLWLRDHLGSLEVDKIGR